MVIILIVVVIIVVLGVVVITNPLIVADVKIFMQVNREVCTAKSSVYDEIFLIDGDDIKMNVIESENSMIDSDLE